MINLNKLRPFGRFCVNLGMIPTSYSEALSYEEQIIWLINYIEKEIKPCINENVEAIEELQTLITQLKSYVENYFDNLDVQEEINNKLDEMAESGELVEIIAEYLRLAGVLTYNTKNDMKLANNLIEGSICKTLGDVTYNDGYGSFYKIRTITSGDVVDDDKIVALDISNTLIAEKIYNLKLEEIYNNAFYEEITYTANRTDGTDYYLTNIPKFDNDGNLIELYIGKSIDNTDNSPLKYAEKNLTSFTSNATLAIKDSDDKFYDTLVISNGEIINPAHEYATPLANDYQYLCIDDNRNFSSYQANNTTPETLLANGVKQAWLVFYKVIDNGVFIDHNNEISNLKDDIRQILGVKENGDVVLITNDGRTSTSFGFDDEQACNILIANGVINAWELDGGGSSSTMIKTIKINRNYDENLTKDRRIYYTLNARKTLIYKNVAEVYAEISRQKQLLNYQLMNYINSTHNILFAKIDQQNVVGTSTYNTINLTRLHYYGNSNVTIDDNKINIIKSGLYVFRGYVELTLKDGNKYLEIFVNGEQRHLLRFTGYNNFINNIPFDFGLNLEADDVVEFKYYGVNEEVITRGRVEIQYFGL